MAETKNDAGNAPQGPLAQAVKAGAQVGAPVSPPQTHATAQPLAEPPRTTTDKGSAAIDSVLVLGLKSKSKDARLKAIKIAGFAGGPEVAGDLALSAIFTNRSNELDKEVTDAVKSSLCELISRCGSASLPHLDKALIDSEAVFKLQTYVHLVAIAEAIGEAKLVDGAATLEKILGLGSENGKAQMAALEALEKILQK